MNPINLGQDNTHDWIILKFHVIRAGEHPLCLIGTIFLCEKRNLKKPLFKKN